MDASWLRGAFLVLFGYLLGSVPFGILVAKAFDRNVDLRKTGSGNIGATNVARILGKGAGILTLALDAGKGILALALARQLLDPPAHHWLALVGGAVFLGHIFPVYLRFRGGKGVAVALGVVLSLSPETAFVIVVLFVAVLYFTLKICGFASRELLLLPIVPLVAFLALLNGGYFVAFIAAGGQTIGKMAAGIKVVPAADAGAWTDRVPLGTAFLRAAACLISLAPAGAGLLPALLTADRRAVHDRLAHTRVVKA